MLWRRQTARRRPPPLDRRPSIPISAAGGGCSSRSRSRIARSDSLSRRSYSQLKDFNLFQDAAKNFFLKVHEFVGTNPDPLIPPNKKRHGSCRFWKWLGSKVSLCFTCICCCAGFSCECKRPSCSCCPHPKKLCCGNYSCNCGRRCCPELSCCRLPRSCCSCTPCSCCKWPSCCSWNPCCCMPLKCCSCREASCCKMPKCCCSPTISCPEYSCGCVFDCPKCTEVHLCPKCTKPCCVSGCLC